MVAQTREPALLAPQLATARAGRALVSAAPCAIAPAVAETFLFLLGAHLLADFVLQDRWMVTHKRRPSVFALHVALVAGLAWLALASTRPEAWAAVIIIAVTHAAMDWLKLRHLGGGLWPFALDQSAHVMVIAIIAAIWPDLWAQGAWGALAPAERQGSIMAAAVLAGGIAAVRVGAVVLREAIRALGWENEAHGKSLPGAGALIGQLERALILFFMLSGQATGVALLIGAKAVLRIRDEDRRHSEYVIAGTLMSFGWALGVAALTQAALARWTPAPAMPLPSACVQCAPATVAR